MREHGISRQELNTIYKIRNSPDVFKSRLDIMKETISKLKDRAIQAEQNEA